jgi:hypothetical protein
MASVSTSRGLDVADIKTLTEATYTGLRVSIGGGLSKRDLLIGNFPGKQLSGTAKRRGRAGDLVGTYWAGLYLVSERFRTSVADMGAIGWLTTPVRVSGANAPLLLLSITGTCGPLYGVGGERTPGLPRFGVFIDPGLWDGSDFFMPSNSNAIFVLGSVAEEIGRLRLTNVAFESAGLEVLPT